MTSIIVPNTAQAITVATPDNQQALINGTPWINGRGLLDGQNWRDNYQIIHDILASMGSWDDIAGVFTPPGVSVLGQVTNRALTSRFGDRISALDFDGATIQAKIQAAINYANQQFVGSGSGRKILLPPGLLTANLTMLSGAYLYSDHPSATTLQSAPNVLAPVISGGTTNAPIYRWGLESLTIDGNSSNYTNFSNNAMVCGIRVFGYDYILRDLFINNIVGHGMYFDAITISNNEPFESGASDAGGLTENITVFNVGRDGAHWESPHDHRVIGLYVINPSQEVDQGYYGIFTQDGGNGRFFDVHPYVNGPPANLPKYAASFGASCQISNSHFEGGRRNFEFRSSGTYLTNSSIYAPRPANAGDAMVVFSNGDGNKLISCGLSIAENVDMFGVQFGCSTHNSYNNEVVDCYFEGFALRGPANFFRDAGSGLVSCLGDVVSTTGYVLPNTGVSFQPASEPGAPYGIITNRTAIDYNQGNGTPYATLLSRNRPTITGAKGGNAALASLISALAASGRVIDGTSA